MKQVSLLAAGCQPWNHDVCAASTDRFAYCATLAVYIYQVRSKAHAILLAVHKALGTHTRILHLNRARNVGTFDVIPGCEKWRRSPNSRLFAKDLKRKTEHGCVNLDPLATTQGYFYRKCHILELKMPKCEPNLPNTLPRAQSFRLDAHTHNVENLCETLPRSA